MRYFYSVLTAAVLAAGVFGFAGSVTQARAEDAAKKPVSIAVVDIIELQRSSKAAQSIESQLAGIRKGFQEEVEKEEKSLRAKEKEVMAQKGKVDEAEFKKKVQEFQKSLAESQKKIQTRKGKLDKALAASVGKLRSEIVKIVAEIGEKQGLDLVVARTDVVIVSKDYDITKQVMERIDADLPSIKVTVE